MARKWFKLVREDGSEITAAAAVSVKYNDVDALRDAVKDKYSDSHLAGIAPSDLTVFENQAAYDADQKLTMSFSPITDFGKDGPNALIVQVKSRAADESDDYYILPQVQEKVEDAAFVIVEDEEKQQGVGMGVFFSQTLAVTCDNNLTDEHIVGNFVPVALKGEIANVEVVVRNAELDFAILKSDTPRSFIPPWNGEAVRLRGQHLVLASYRLGVAEHNYTNGQLVFAPAFAVCVSPHKRHIMYNCEAYRGDSGPALLIKDGCLVGIHQETINTRSGLFVKEFKDVVRE